MEAELLEKRSLQESRPGLFIQRLLSARTEWKRKCRESKDALQAQRVRIRDLEASRDHWRAVAEQAQRDLLSESVQQTAQVEKKVRPKSS